MIIAADALTRFAQSVVAASGSAAPEAEEVAIHLVEANLKGHDSHGVGVIPTYVRNVREGHLKGNIPFDKPSRHILRPNRAVE